MQLEHVQILIERDAMTKVPKVIRPWELPVYEAMYDDGEEDATAGFSVSGRVVVEVDEIPDASEEFARMRAFYGVDSTGQPWADVAYDRGRKGVAMLRKAINEAFGADSVDDDEPEAPKAKRGRKAAQNEAVDPLADA